MSRSEQEKSKNTLIKIVGDRRWIDFFYLDSFDPSRSIDALYERLHALTFTFVPNSRDIPFTAQIRGYKGAVDEQGMLWLLKEVQEEEQFLYTHCELVYYLDCLLATLSAPTLLVQVDGVPYRATKVIIEATQISGYNYLEEPFRKILAKDLINRWWMFDEDRNPNNYMVIHNSKRQPLVVAIDFNHADLQSKKMKITGNPKRFGWFREEKTRFLTLLKPENFEAYSIEDFEDRLNRMVSIPEERLNGICRRLFAPVVADPEEKAAKITANLITRRSYIDEYFRKSLKKKNRKRAAAKTDQYEGLGKQFVEIYKKKI